MRITRTEHGLWQVRVVALWVPCLWPCTRPLTFPSISPHTGDHTYEWFHGRAGYCSSSVHLGRVCILESTGGKGYPATSPITSFQPYLEAHPLWLYRPHPPVPSAWACTLPLSGVPTFFTLGLQRQIQSDGHTSSSSKPPKSIVWEQTKTGRLILGLGGGAGVVPWDSAGDGWAAVLTLDVSADARAWPPELLQWHWLLGGALTKPH